MKSNTRKTKYVDAIEMSTVNCDMLVIILFEIKFVNLKPYL